VWEVEVLARRLRVRWSPPISDAQRLGIEPDRGWDTVTRTDGYPRLLYWSAADPPQRFIRNDVPPGDRALVIHALLHGWRVVQMAGFARCRICDTALGSSDKAVHGMVYPEKAEHYLLEHDVWTPGCDELLRRLQTRSRT